MESQTVQALVRQWIFPMVKAGREFVVPHGEEALVRIHEEGGYDPPFFSFLDRFLRALTRPGWAPGSYFPGGWYRSLQRQGDDPRLAEATVEALRPFYGDEVLVDRQGRWRVGPRPIEGRVLRFFLRHLHYDPTLERYYVRFRVENLYDRRYLHHESPPFRVVVVEPAADPPRVRLNDGTWEPLRPATLWLDAKEELHCPVKAQGLPARFADTARWEILKTLEERDGRMIVRVGDRAVILRRGP